MLGGCTDKQPFRHPVRPTTHKAPSRRRHSERWSRKVGQHHQPVGWIRPESAKRQQPWRWRSRRLN
eukprot:12203833-Alexandrium_andersonii.AAC.1